ncbi:hypothetical protein NKG94_41130 [Micromonospora sp. M12]
MTFWNFVAMAVGAGTVLYAARERSFGLYLAGFLALFVFSGVGNGSTYKMIPAIFRAGRRTRWPRDATTRSPPRGGPGG